MATSTAKAVGYEVRDGVLVVLYGQRTPTSAEWSSFLSVLDQELERAKGVFCYGAGPGGPTARQQYELTEHVRARGGTKAAVVTGSPLSRGLGAATEWLQQARDGRTPMAFYSPQEVVAAYDYLGLGVPERIAVGAALDELRAELAPPLSDAETGPESPKAPGP